MLRGSLGHLIINFNNNNKKMEKYTLTDRHTHCSIQPFLFGSRTGGEALHDTVSCQSTHDSPLHCSVVVTVVVEPFLAMCHFLLYVTFLIGQRGLILKGYIAIS